MQNRMTSGVCPTVATGDFAKFRLEDQTMSILEDQSMSIVAPEEARASQEWSPLGLATARKDLQFLNWLEDVMDPTVFAAAHADAVQRVQAAEAAQAETLRVLREVARRRRVYRVPDLGPGSSEPIGVGRSQARRRARPRAVRVIRRRSARAPAGDPEPADGAAATAPGGGRGVSPEVGAPHAISASLGNAAESLASGDEAGAFAAVARLLQYVYDPQRSAAVAAVSGGRLDLAQVGAALDTGILTPEILAGLSFACWRLLPIGEGWRVGGELGACGDCGRPRIVHRYGHVSICVRCAYRRRRVRAHVGRPVVR
jgi:hypothetical protein